MAAMNAMTRLGQDRKAVFFMIDAIIAALIFIVGLLLLSSAYVSDQPTVTLHYIAQDVLNVLSEMSVGEINNTYVQQLAANGSIENTNNSLLEQMAEFYVKGDLVQAQEFISNVTQGLVPLNYGFGIYINDEAIYKRSDLPEENVVLARKIVSGIEKEKPINGYVARAIARTVDRNTSIVIPISPEGSGWGSGGWFQSIKWFNFTGDYSIEKVTLYVSAHVGNSNSDVRIRINDNPSCYYQINNMSMQRQETLSGQGRGIFGVISVPKTCINIGLNNLTFNMTNADYNSHFHPGTFMVIDYYNSEAVVGEISSTVSNRIYFDDIKSFGSSTNGVFQIVPFEIPEGATDVSVSIRVNTKNVADYTGTNCCESEGGSCVVRCRDVDYRIYLNTASAMHTVASPQQNATYNYWPSNTSSRLKNGTNVIGVYLNTYDDYRFGMNNVEIYSRPFTDPLNSSYVEVNYTYAPPLSGGAIEVRLTKQFGGSWLTPKTGNFTFPEEAVAISTVYTHIVQIFSAMVRGRSGMVNPPTTEIFLAPAVRMAPTAIYVPSNTISPDYAVTNFIRVEDTYGDPRDFGPNTTIDYGFYLPSFVTYAGTFMTEELAVQDAQDRLEELLGDYVNLEDVEFENSSITEVPSLWGPAIIGVKIWN